MKLSAKSLLATIVVFLSLVAPGLAGAYEDGMAARSRGDYAKAAVFIREASDQGHAQAQFNLGVMYNNGQGVPQDDARIAAWFRQGRRTEPRSGPVQPLGVAYAEGMGVPQHTAQAVRWYRKAATSTASYI